MDTSEETDPLLYSHQAAELAGLKTRTWLKYVAAGYAPKPDDPDADRPPNRRMARWRRSQVLYFTSHRIGQGKRTDLRKKADAGP